MPRRCKRVSRSRRVTRFTLAAAFALGAVVAMVLSVIPTAAVPIGPVESTPAAALPPYLLAPAVSLPTSLSLRSSASVLNTSFWGTTISPRAPLFPNESALVDATPARTVVWPGANAGDQYDPFTNQIWANNNTHENASTTEAQFVRWCESIGCHAILEVPGEVDNPALATSIVSYTESTLGFHPEYWQIGNEPGFWSHWGQSWGNWTTKTAPPSPQQYANEVLAYAQNMTAIDPSIKLIGLPGVGNTGHGYTVASWIDALIQTAGDHVSAIAIHIYPDLSKVNDTLSQFYQTLNDSNPQSIPGRVPGLRSAISAAIASYCPRCGPITLIITEIGSAISNRPDSLHWSVGFPETLYVAAEITQAMDYNISNVDAFATVLDTGNSWFDLAGEERPLYELQSQVLDRLGDTAYPVSFSGGPLGLFGIATVDPHEQDRADLLVVNTNLTTAATFTPTLPGGPFADPAEVWAWNNNSTRSPVASFDARLPGSYSLPPNSLVLFESQPYSVVPIRFNETGLPSHTRWFLNLDNRTETTESTNLTFYLPPGTYPVSPGPVLGFPGNARHERWSPRPPTTVSVSAAWENLTVPYQLQFSVNSSVWPQGAGRISPTVHWWDANSSLNLSVQPSSGWVFRGWSGGGPGNYTGRDTVARLIVRGAIVERALYAPGYVVNFTESGLPAGTPWTVEEGGATYSGNGSSIYLLATNGTHGYRVEPTEYYTPHPASGAFTVNGTYPTPISILFDETAHGAGAYPVVFEESHLPNGTNWSVIVLGKRTYSSSPYLVLYETNGSYEYQVTPVPDFAARPSQGTFDVSGTAQTIPVDFAASPPTNGTRFAVVFAENGLPANSDWSVTVENDTATTNTADLVFLESNGTYAYHVGDVPKFTAHPALGEITVTGTPLAAVAIGFARTGPHHAAEYPVLWAETGLANNTTWSLTVRQVAYASNSPFIVTTERNGSYAFVVTPFPGFASAPHKAGFSVAGGPVNLTVRFHRLYALTFTEVGLPSGSPWEVRLDGPSDFNRSASSTPVISMLVWSGNWTFVADPPGRYVANPLSSVAEVGNVSMNETIVFSVATATSLVGRLAPEFEEVGHALAVTAVVVAGGGLTFVLLSRRDQAEPDGDGSVARTEPPSTRQREPLPGSDQESSRGRT